MKNGIKLAIILPYYKNDFIKEALASIQAQTNKKFNLYIGDDASPNSISEYLAEVEADLKKRTLYHRFADNLGGKSLTRQWDRCIELANDEAYIWLFSDDDIMPNDAVQRFYDFIDTTESVDLLRFNVNIINGNGQSLGEILPHPSFETAQSFASRRLHGQCISTACEYIFTKKIYNNKNKFVEFPLAWCSDDATWIKFSEEKGIVTISGKPVFWRMSGLNISSDSEKAYQLKFSSAILFIKFLRERFTFSRQEELEWLLGQLHLVGHLSKYKKEFYRQLTESNLFNVFFIKKYMAERKIKTFIHKVKRRLKG